VLHQLGIPRDIYKVELRFRAKDIITYIISLLICRMSMSLLGSLISFQQFLKWVEDVTDEAVSFQFLKRAGDIAEEAW